MKRTKLLAFTLSIVLLSLFLSGCRGTAAIANSWPGITVSGDTAYIAFNQNIFALDINNSGRVLETYPSNSDDRSLRGAMFYHPPVLLGDESLLAGNYNNIFYEIELDSGTASEFFSEARNRWIATPLLTENRVYAPNANGFLYALDLSGSMIWEFETNAAIWATPVLVDNRLVVVSQDHFLYIINATSGELIKDVDLGATAVNGPAVDDKGILYIGTFEKKLLAINSANGEILWELETIGWVWGSPVLAENGTIFLTDLDANLYAIDPITREILWSKQVETNTSITGSPLIYNDTIYVVTRSGTIASYDFEGERLWKEDIATEDNPVEFHGTPVAAENGLILVSAIESDTAVYAFNTELEIVWLFSPDN